MAYRKTVKLLPEQKNGFFKAYHNIKGLDEILICETLDNDVQPNGQVEIYHPRENKETGYYKHSEGSMVDGQRQGEWTKYSEDGLTQSTMEYVDNVIHGKKHTVYVDSGATHSEILYINGEKHSDAFYYDQNGAVTKTVTYKHGKKHGWTNKFYKKPEHDGGLKSKTFYQNGQAEGLGYYYKPNGQLRSVVLYKDGEVAGEATANLNSSLNVMRMMDNAWTMLGKSIGKKTRSIEQRNQDQLELLEVRYPKYFEPNLF